MSIVIQPHSIEAEQALLGYILNKPELTRRIGLAEADFFEPVHARIWHAIRSRVERGEAVSVPLLAEQFNRDEALTDLGGSEYLDRLAYANYPMGDEVGALAAELRGLSQRRALIQVAEQLTLQAQEPGASTAEILGSSWSDLKALSVSTRKIALHSVKDIGREVIRNAGRAATVLSTGIPALDAALAGGLPVPGLVGFIARPAVGKSTMIQTISLNTARQGVPSCVYALEMGEVAITSRYLGAAGEFDSNLLRFDDDTVRDMATAALEELPDCLYLVERSGLRWADLKSEWHDLAVNHGIKVFGLDYFTLVRPDKDDNIVKFYDDLAAWLHEFAKEHKVTVVTAAQELRNKDGQIYIRGGDGLQNAADFVYSLRPVEEPLIHRTLGPCKQVWGKQTKGRFGGGDIGSEDQPCLILNPNGPYFMQV